ncbi:hypothetical protein E8Q33_12225 [Methylophaga sp. SB9B]|uniref:gamma-mobile-trio protein GmtX n=1 Tax=Methylophaga sp. SB9B TaxID=2570356 RepID=UPI0010A89462|nr:gamma-mobile-trio protein GmtX [Methylophaga sp. SB9B]THK40810.1 hypothetical protein E8Q33_12225 [Methylophaga sp. SB9B]
MNEANIKKQEIDNKLEEFFTNYSPLKRSKLKAFSDVCERLVKLKAQLKATTISREMTNNGFSIATQSIYNKTSVENPYRTLLELWQEYSELSNSKTPVNISTQNAGGKEFVTDEDLSSIKDPALRYRISLMLAETRGLRKQNDMLKQIKDMNFIQSVPENLIGSKAAEKIILDKHDLDNLEGFINSSPFVYFDDDGRGISKKPIPKETAITDFGFREAIIKILNSYNRGD